MRHNSSLVCMVGISYVYIVTIFAFHGYIPFSFFLYSSLLPSWMFEHDCLGTCLKLHTCVLYFCICTCSAQLSVFHTKRRSRNTLIIITTIIIIIINTTTTIINVV